mgnify:CR=1 FL=1
MAVADEHPEGSHSGDRGSPTVIQYPIDQVQPRDLIIRFRQLFFDQAIAGVRLASFRILIWSGVSNIEEQASFVANGAKHGIDQGLLRPIDQPAGL